jgi:hypothetical protein
MTMHHFAVYEASTGRVLRTGRSTNEAALALQAHREGEALYVGEIDARTTYLPGGVPTPKEPETVVVTAGEVKAFAGRLLSYTDWYVTRRADTGEDIPAGISAYRQAVREASDALEDMDPIPVDFRDAHYWPAL